MYQKITFSKHVAYKWKSYVEVLIILVVSFHIISIMLDGFNSIYNPTLKTKITTLVVSFMYAIIGIISFIQKFRRSLKMERLWLQAWRQELLDIGFVDSGKYDEFFLTGKFQDFQFSISAIGEDRPPILIVKLYIKLPPQNAIDHLLPTHFNVTHAPYLVASPTEISTTIDFTQKTTPKDIYTLLHNLSKAVEECVYRGIALKDYAL